MHHVIYIVIHTLQGGRGDSTTPLPHQRGRGTVPHPHHTTGGKGTVLWLTHDHGRGGSERWTIYIHTYLFDQYVPHIPQHPTVESIFWQDEAQIFSSLSTRSQHRAGPLAIKRPSPARHRGQGQVPHVPK